MFMGSALGLINYVWELIAHGRYLWQYDTEAVFAYLWSILALSVLCLMSVVAIREAWAELKRSGRNS